MQKTTSALVLFITCMFGCGASDTSTVVLGNLPAYGASDIGVFRTILANGNVPDPSVLSQTGFFAEHVFPRDTTCSGVLCVEPSLAIARRFDGTAWTMAGVLLRSNTTLSSSPVHHVLVLESGLLSASDWQALATRITGAMQAEDRVSVYTLGANLTTLLENQTRDGNIPPIGSQVVVPEFYANLRQLRSRLRFLGENGAIPIHTTVVTSGLRATANPELPQLGDDNSIIELLRSMAESGNVITLVGTTRDSEAGQVQNYDETLPNVLARARSGPVLFAENRVRLLELLAREVAEPPIALARNVSVRVVAGPSYLRGPHAGAEVQFELANEVTFAIPTFWARTRAASAMNTLPILVELLVNEASGDISANQTAYALEVRYQDGAGSHTETASLENPLAPGFVSTQGPRFVTANGNADASAAPLYTMLAAYQTMRTGLEYFSAGDCARARATLQLGEASLGTWRSALPPQNLENDVTLVATVQRVVSNRCRLGTSNGTVPSHTLRLVNLTR